MDNKRKKKTLVLSAAIASMLLPPLTMNAQYDESRYGQHSYSETSLFRRENNRSGNVTLGDAIIENQTEVPLGSGISLFVTIGAGYAVLKRKEKKQ